MMQLVLHDSNAGINGSTWLKSNISPNFGHGDLINAMISITITIGTTKIHQDS